MSRNPVNVSRLGATHRGTACKTRHTQDVSGASRQGPGGDWGAALTQTLPQAAHNLCTVLEMRLV